MFTACLQCLQWNRIRIDKCMALFKKRMTEFADQKSTVDFGEWLQWYAFDVVGELFFGDMFGFMERSEDHESYIESLDAILPVLASAAVSSPVARFAILGSSMISRTTRTALKASDHIADAARACVKKRMAQSDTAEKTDVLERLLDITKDKGEKADFGFPKVQYEAWVAMFAGSDTTAIAMRAIFYYLMKHPEDYKALQNEIDDATAAGALSRPPRYSEALALPLLCATVKEAMRLHPSVGLTMPRIVPAGGIEVAGTYIPASYQVGMNAAVVGYDKGIYGDDSHKFRPSRWLEKDSSLMEKHNLVFGAGTRTCIGKNISLCEIHKLLPMGFQEFDVRLLDQMAEWTTENFWFNKQKGLTVTLQFRRLMN